MKRQSVTIKVQEFKRFQVRGHTWESKVKVIRVILSRRVMRKKHGSQPCLFTIKLNQTCILIMIFIQRETNLILVIGRQLGSHGEARDRWIK